MGSLHDVHGVHGLVLGMLRILPAPDIEETMNLESQLDPTLVLDALPHLLRRQSGRKIGQAGSVANLVHRIVHLRGRPAILVQRLCIIQIDLAQADINPLLNRVRLEGDNGRIDQLFIRYPVLQ